MSGETSLLLRSESVLVFWQDGLALFRVRLSRCDGAVVEAHGAAHDGEAEQFWTLAENRARGRAQELLDDMPMVQPGRLLPPSAAAGTPMGAATGTRTAPPDRRPPERPAAARMPEAPQTPTGPAHRSAAVDSEPAAGTANGLGSGNEEAGRDNAHKPAGEAVPPSGSEDVGAPISPAAATTPNLVSTYVPDDDPFSDEVQFADEPAGDGETPSSSRAGFAPTEAAEGRQPGHIRPETGGAGRTPAPVRTAGPTGPAPNATDSLQCSAPGCSVTLTPAQRTMSTHKFGQALCPTHMKERSELS